MAHPPRGVFPHDLAPQGEHQSLPVGTKVLYDHVFYETVWWWNPEVEAWTPQFPHRADNYVQFRGYAHQSLSTPLEGVVVGWRYPVSGRYHPGYGSYEDYEPGYRETSRVHRCYLVASIDSPRSAPFYVLMEDVEVKG